MVTLASAASAEVLASLGFDWLFIDGEHGPLETRELTRDPASRRATRRRASCACPKPPRCRSRRRSISARTASSCRRSTRPSRPPTSCAGRATRPKARAASGSRARTATASTFREYLSAANREIAVIVQAEHARAVENIEAIVRVPGVDAVLLGPYDLSASLGKMGEIDDPAVVAAIGRVTDACRAAGMPLGYFGVTAAAVQPYVARGYTLIVAGVDTLYLANGAKALLKELRGA